MRGERLQTHLLLMHQLVIALLWFFLLNHPGNPLPPLECQAVPFELKVFEVHPPVLPGSSPRRMSVPLEATDNVGAASKKMTEFGDSFAKIDLFFI